MSTISPPIVFIHSLSQPIAIAYPVFSPVSRHVCWSVEGLMTALSVPETAGRSDPFPAAGRTRVSWLTTKSHGSQLKAVGRVGGG